MEFCRRWGIVDWVERAGYNRDHPQGCAWVSALAGRLRVRTRAVPAPRRNCPPQSPQKRERCPQNFFDPVIARFARRSRMSACATTPNSSASKNMPARCASKCRTSDRAQVDHRGPVPDRQRRRRQREVREQLGIRLPGPRCPDLHDQRHLPLREPSGTGWTKGRIPLHLHRPQGTWCTMVAINGRDEYRFRSSATPASARLTEPELRRSDQEGRRPRLRLRRSSPPCPGSAANSSPTVRLAAYSWWATRHGSIRRPAPSA